MEKHLKTTTTSLGSAHSQLSAINAEMVEVKTARRLNSKTALAPRRLWFFLVGHLRPVSAGGEELLLAPRRLWFFVVGHLRRVGAGGEELLLEDLQWPLWRLRLLWMLMSA